MAIAMTHTLRTSASSAVATDVSSPRRDHTKAPRSALTPIDLLDQRASTTVTIGIEKCAA